MSKALALLRELNQVDIDTEYDVVLRNGKIMSPGDIETNEADFKKVGDVGIRDGKIVAIGEPNTFSGKDVIDCTGKVVSPGWFDVNCHSSTMLLQKLQAVQGVTTSAGFETGAFFDDSNEAISRIGETTKYVNRIYSISIETIFTMAKLLQREKTEGPIMNENEVFNFKCYTKLPNGDVHPLYKGDAPDSDITFTPEGRLVDLLASFGYDTTLPGFYEWDDMWRDNKKIDADAYLKSPSIHTYWYTAILGAPLNEEELEIAVELLNYYKEYQRTSCVGFVPGYFGRYATKEQRDQPDIKREIEVFFSTCAELGLPIEIHVSKHNLSENIDNMWTFGEAERLGTTISICHIHAQVNTNNERMSALRGDNATVHTQLIIDDMDRIWNAGGRNVYGDMFPYDFGNSATQTTGANTSVGWYYGFGIPATVFTFQKPSWTDSNSVNVHKVTGLNREGTACTKFYKEYDPATDTFSGDAWTHAGNVDSGRIEEMLLSESPLTEAEIAQDVLLCALNDAAQETWFVSAKGLGSGQMIYYTGQEHTFLEMWRKPWAHFTSDGTTIIQKESHPRIFSAVARAWAIIRDGLAEQTVGNVNIPAVQGLGSGDDIVMEFINFAATKAMKRFGKFSSACRGRGQIKEGYHADICVWDPLEFGDRAFPQLYFQDYDTRPSNVDWCLPAEGVYHVINTGSVVVRDGIFDYTVTPAKLLFNEEADNRDEYRKRPNAFDWVYDGTFTYFKPKNLVFGTPQADGVEGNSLRKELVLSESDKKMLEILNSLGGCVCCA